MHFFLKIGLWITLVIVIGISIIVPVVVYRRQSISTNEITTQVSTSTISTTTKIPSLMVQSKYSSALTVNSLMYCRQSSCVQPDTYYEAIRIHVPNTGNYTFTSISAIDTYGSMYNNTFISLVPYENLLISDDDSGDNSQFLFTILLQSIGNYTLVVTTFYPNVLGSFSIVATGPKSVSFSRINTSDDTSGLRWGYAAYLTTDSQTYCQNSICPGSIFYYQAVSISVGTSGPYIIVCDADIDICCYLYNSYFDPSSPAQNLIPLNDGSDSNTLMTLLQSTIVYTLVVTTRFQNVTGLFTIIVSGAGPVGF